ARRVAIEAGEPLLYIGGVGDLVHLPVAHHVDAGLHLAADDHGHGIADHGIVTCLRGLAGVAAEQDVHDLLRARQAADMRGEDAFGARSHASRRRSAQFTLDTASEKSTSRYLYVSRGSVP